MRRDDNGAHRRAEEQREELRRWLMAQPYIIAATGHRDRATEDASQVPSDTEARYVMLAFFTGLPIPAQQNANTNPPSVFERMLSFFSSANSEGYDPNTNESVLNQRTPAGNNVLQNSGNNLPHPPRNVNRRSDPVNEYLRRAERADLNDEEAVNAASVSEFAARVAARSSQALNAAAVADAEAGSIPWAPVRSNQTSNPAPASQFFSRTAGSNSAQNDVISAPQYQEPPAGFAIRDLPTNNYEYTPIKFPTK